MKGDVDLKLTKIFLTLLVAFFFNSIQAYANQSLSQSENHSNISNQSSLENFVKTNLDSLFFYQIQIKIGSVFQDSRGNIVAKNILILSEGSDNPNISIKEMTFSHLKVNEYISRDFDMKIIGLKISNLGESIAHNNIVASSVNPTYLLQKSFYNIFMNNLANSIYNLNIKYIQYNKTLDIKIDSTNSEDKFFTSDVKLKALNLSKVKVDQDLFASLIQSIGESKLDSANFDINLSKLLENVIKQYFNKNYKQTPYLNIKANLDSQSGDFKINVDGELGSQINFKYNAFVKGINLFDTKLKDIALDPAVLNNAYIESNKSNANISLNFNKNDFVKSPTILRLFKIFDKDNVAVNIKSNSGYNDSKYSTNFYLGINELAKMFISESGIVKGNLNLLKYFGAKDGGKSLYNCNNEACLTNFKSSFVNQGLLQKIVGNTANANNPPNQVLASYGALLQLIATQQKSGLLQQAMSSLAIFLQSPKNININAKAYKPLNQKAFATKLVNDVSKINENNITKNININSIGNNIQVINDIQKLFKVNFEVNK